MNDAAFDRKMTQWAQSDQQPVSDARLEYALRQLGDRPGELVSAAPRRALPKRRALAVAFALLMLLAATAVAATLGLSHFFKQNPYAFTRDGETTLGVQTAPLLVIGDSDLSTLRVEAMDSAWIGGQLTLSVFVASADPDETLYVGELDESDTALLYPDSLNHPPTTLDGAKDARILLWDNFSVYTLPDSGDGQWGYPQQVETSPQEDGTLIAMQIDPDFVSTSDLAVLAKDGRLPFSLEFTLSDHGTLRFERIALSAALPDERSE